MKKSTSLSISFFIRSISLSLTICSSSKANYLFSAHDGLNFIFQLTYHRYLNFLIVYLVQILWKNTAFRKVNLVFVVDHCCLCLYVAKIRELLILNELKISLSNPLTNLGLFGLKSVLALATKTSSFEGFWLNVISSI